MDKIIFATGNEHKMVEIRMILEDLGIEVLSQREAGIEAEVVEDGTTFEENALIKAKGIAAAARQMPEYGLCQRRRPCQRRYPRERQRWRCAWLLHLGSGP